MSFQSVDEIIKHYTKEDKPMREYDKEMFQDEIDEEQQERYQRALQRRLALCGSRTYPSVYARQDILDAERERNRLMGIDISEQEETE